MSRDGGMNGLDFAVTAGLVGPVAGLLLLGRPRAAALYGAAYIALGLLTFAAAVTAIRWDLVVHPWDGGES